MEIYNGVPQERLDLASCVLARNCALHPGDATMRHERDALRFQGERGAVVFVFAFPQFHWGLLFGICVRGLNAGKA